MSVTVLAAAVMMAYAGAPPLPVLAYESVRVVELPGWFRALQDQPFEYAPVMPTVPNSCPAGKESLASGRCADDCRRGGSCRRIKVAAEDQVFRDAQGRVIGRASPQGEGSVRYYDSQGRSLGTSTTDPSGGQTRYYSPGGKSLGTSTGPRRPLFPERR
jgi:YD repeat-containing protein